MFDVKNKSQNAPSHKPKKEFETKKSENFPVIQRLVYNKSKNILYTNKSWKSKQFSPDADNDTHKPILIGNAPDYHIDNDCRKFILGSYGIYQNDPVVNFQVSKKNDKNDILSTITLSKRKAQRRLYRKLKDDINNKLNDEYYLYNCDNWSSFALNNVECKAVLPPEDLCDPLGSSDTNKEWKDSLKSKVCVLIAIVKQMEASATGNDRYTRQQNFKNLLTSSTVFAGCDGLCSKVEEYLASVDSGKIYNLIQTLHNFVYEKTDYQAYDLDRVNEKLYTDLGYTRIISCNCSFNDFGTKIPEEVTLEKDKTYIFIIEGHAMAVTMKKNLSHSENQISPDEYFSPQNDSENFNDDWTDKKVRQVLER